jgi:hypothetical protein
MMMWALETWWSRGGASHFFLSFFPILSFILRKLGLEGESGMLAYDFLEETQVED